MTRVGAAAGALAAAVLLGTAGCAPETPSSAGASSTPTSTTRKPPTTSPGPIDPDKRSCYYFDSHVSDLTAPNPAAPPYAGPGPHPVAFGDSRQSPDGDALYSYGINGIAELLGASSWAALGFPPAVEDRAQAQLVLCEAGKFKRATTPIGACDFNGLAQGPVYPTTYKFSVMENRTRRVVTTLAIDGDVDGDLSCPVSITTELGVRHEYGQAIKPETVVAALRPLVMGNAG